MQYNNMIIQLSNCQGFGQALTMTCFTLESSSDIAWPATVCLLWTKKEQTPEITSLDVESVHSMSVYCVCTDLALPNAVHKKEARS